MIRFFLIVFNIWLFLLALPRINYADPGAVTYTDNTTGWQTGYWLWRMPYNQNLAEANEARVDVLYVEVGDCMYWPEKAPRASSYFAVVRHDGLKAPVLSEVPDLAARYQRLKKAALKSGQQLTGIQIDFDCPTELLNEYGHFLRRLRETLPREDRISITALLDWFRKETRIADVLEWVDEYVPQFYDVGSGRVSTAAGIAAAIDPATWAPIFNSYSKPYKIGISIFGRIATITEDHSCSSSNSIKTAYFRGETPLQIIKEQHAQPRTVLKSRAGETIVQYKAKAHCQCKPVDGTLEITIPTQQSVLAAYSSAQAMGGRCAGVVFFRWSAKNEAMVLTPAEVQRVISGGSLAADVSMLETEDGLCATTSCTNLFVRLKNRFPEKDVSLRIRSSVALEYFLPERLIDAMLRGSNIIDFKLPPYAGVPRVYIGRAVTLEPSHFSLEEKQ